LDKAIITAQFVIPVPIWHLLGIPKWDRFYYKVRQLFITKWDIFLLHSGTAFYYKVGQLFITKWDRFYYKMGQLFITKWDKYYKVGQFLLQSGLQQQSQKFIFVVPLTVFSW